MRVIILENFFEYKTEFLVLPNPSFLTLEILFIYWDFKHYMFAHKIWL